MLRNSKRRFQRAIVESLKLRVGDFSCGEFQSDKAFGVADIVPDFGIFRTGVALGRPEKREDLR